MPAFSLVGSNFCAKSFFAWLEKKNGCDLSWILISLTEKKAAFLSNKFVKPEYMGSINLVRT